MQSNTVKIGVIRVKVQFGEWISKNLRCVELGNVIKH